MKTTGKKRITVPYRWETQTIVITILCIVVLVGVWAVVVAVNSHAAGWLKWVLGIVCLGAIPVSAAYLPRSLSVADRKITLRRLVGRIDIPLDEVVVVRKIEPMMLDGSSRVFGSGGLFGYLGRFRNRRLGTYSMWITEQQNLLLVETVQRRWVFNCRRADEFIRIATEERGDS
ncbi:PH domain-containing protein [uncultured Rikenella sp.]|uniref:PH domain-containing protein n=1 Tax=uncultured Rikenella sp. TaxID=368003 RepID=UPI0026296EE3|nr:PH domain-containing protein [uncultured Rikenella sp.]